MTTTPAQRRATARAIKKRELAGIKRSTFSLPADARERLEALKAETGMPKDRIVAAAILAYHSTPPVQDTAAGPESAIEQTQAERRSREPPEKAKAPHPTSKTREGRPEGS